MMRNFYFLLLFFCVGAQAAPLQLGDKAPNWLLTKVNGEQVSLYDEADAGRSTLMVFWSSWCQRCAQVLPEIAKLKKSLLDAPVTFYALNVWEDKPIHQYLESHPVELDVVVRADDVAKRFNIGQTTAVIVVGADKKLRYISPPDINAEELIQQLSALLKPAPTDNRKSVDT